jgi:hypothetical protein
MVDISDSDGTAVDRQDGAADVGGLVEARKATAEGPS